MSRLTPLIVACLWMGGCSLIGNKRGEDNAPPTQMAFSLYASPDVNPNPDSVAPDPTAPVFQTPAPAALTVAPAVKEGPYLLNLRGTSKADLAGQVRLLLDYLDGDIKTESAPFTYARLNPPFAPSAETVASTTTPIYLLGIPYLPLASSWAQPRVDSALPALVAPPLSPANANETRQTSVTPSGPAPALGQYADGASSGFSSDAPQQAPNAMATPITFKILQLKDDSVFLNADHDQLSKDLKKALGSTYLSHEDYVLQPGQFKYLDYEKIDKKAHYVAVLANFHNQNGAVWKQVLRLEPKGQRYAVFVIFRNVEVAIVDEGYRPPPSRN